MNKKVNSLTKTWYILSPFILYIVMKNIAMLLLLAGALTLCKNTGIAHFMPFLNNQNLVHTTCNGIASIIAVAFLYRKFLDETTFRGEYDPDANVFRQTMMRLKTSIEVHKKKWMAFLLVPLFAGFSAIAMNMLMSILPVTSEEYGRVADIQYSVPVWLGMILYGVIAPAAEEVVFRGMMYNRMKRCFSPAISIAVTSFMFGAFHGNVVQMIYAMTLGVLMTLTYEWLSSFWGPLLFHMSANVVIYLCSTLFTNKIPVNILSCGIFLIVAVIAGGAIYISSMKVQH